MATEPEVPSEAPRRGFHVPAWVLGVIGAVVLFVVAFGIGRATGNGDDHEGRFGGDGNGHHVVRLLILLALLALIAYGIYVLVRHFSARSAAAAAPPSPTDDARRVLAERLARGEIDEGEYRRRRDALLD